ncbi:eCIS core domain-containing protein [Streptomyces sp. CA-135486]|uniref:eCIS core domain-containing protein n=1 Tax=Streptomyces sp. CA-135486 TaxID=3240049 RepID=UPI003D8E24F7
MTTAPEHTTRDGRPPALLALLRNEGRRLDADVRGTMERSLGAPFGDVVVHAGPASAAAADQAQAAAFTVGRHVVIGSGGYDPDSPRGRMLLAHELAHVVQQRRGGGDLDLGEALPGPALPRHAHGHAEGAARTAAAQSALGMAAPVSGAAAVGVARQDKEEEKDWKSALWAKAKEKIRDKTKETLGVVEGVALEAGQIVDTVAWVPYAAQAAVDKAIDTAGTQLGASKETLTAIKEAVPGAPALNAIKAKAVANGMVDPVTGTPMVTGKITEGFDAAEKVLDEHVFRGVKKEEGFFTYREVGQLKGAIGAQVALSFVGVEEVQLALKAVSGIGAFKAIVDAVQHNVDGFASDRRFWTAVAGALLHVVGLRSASSGKKLLTVVVDVGMTALSGASELAQLREDYLKPESEERDKALRKDIQALIRLVAGAVQQALSHHRSLKQAGAKADAEGSAPPARGGDAPAPDPATTTKPVSPAATGEPPPVPAPPKTAGTEPPAVTGGVPPAPTAGAEPHPAAAGAGTAPGAGAKAVKNQLAEAISSTKGLPEQSPAPSAVPQAKTVAGTGPKPAGANVEPVSAHKPSPSATGQKPRAKSVKEAQLSTKAARKRLEAAVERKRATDEGVVDAKRGVADAHKELDVARKAAVTAAGVHAEAPKGARQEPRKASTRAKERVRDAEKALKAAEKTLAKARAEAKDATDRNRAAKRRFRVRNQELGDALAAKAARSAKAAEAAKEADKPRLGPNDVYDPKKFRRPDLRSFKGVTPAPFEIIGADGLRKNPESRVTVFHDPLGSHVAPVKGATPQERGHDLERAGRDDLTGGSKIRVSHNAGDKTRHGDIGSYEVKNKESLSSDDLDQLWRDLNNPARGHSALIITPRLHPGDDVLLARVAAIFEKVTGIRPHISVRELEPPK